MSFPADLASVLSGATPHQLRSWRRTGLLIPEVSPGRPPLYSFRDVVALRAVVRLRGATSLQKIRAAFAALPEFDLTDHPSEYRFATDGKSVAVETEDGFLDLVRNKGAVQLFTLAEIYEPFTTKQGVEVVDFTRPREHLEVNARRMGGWPTASGTRVTYDVIAEAVDGETLTYDDVPRFYPGVTPIAARDAVDFDHVVKSRRQGVAA
jgi:uncharacterized protein (DUF433 family)